MGRQFDQKAFHERGETWSLAPMFVVTDRRLSFCARCILIFGLGKPDTWVHSVESLARALGGHRDTVRKALGELEVHGYATRRIWREGPRQSSDTTFHYPPLEVDQGGQSSGAETSAVLIEGGLTEGVTKEGATKEEVEPSSAAPTGEHLDVVQEEVEDHEPPTVATTPQTINGKPVDPGATKPRSFAVMDEDQELPPPVVKAPRSFAIMDGDDGEPVTTKTRQSHPRPSGDEQFDQFWVLYAKPKGKKAALDQWKIAIKKADPDVILAAVPGYVASNHDPKYRKDPERWLKGEHWTDGVIASPKTNGAHHVAYRDPTDLSVYRKSLRRTMP